MKVFFHKKKKNFIKFLFGFCIPMAVQLNFAGYVPVVGGNATGFIQSSYSWQLSVVFFFGFNILLLSAREPLHLENGGTILVLHICGV